MMKSVWMSFGMVLLATSVQAEEAPPPRRMPRIPVSREFLPAARDAMPPSREKHGTAAVIDGEKLRIGETNLRLFGIVPPQLSASFGPQVRTELDGLAAGQNVSCQIRDRDREGWLLATCQNGSGHDMALELLKRGMAVAARGSIADSELAASYLAAEQAAQAQKIGIWSASASTGAVSGAPAAPSQAKAEPATQTAEAAKQDAKAQAKIAADVLSTQFRLDEMGGDGGEEKGFFERYQILMSGVLTFLTALSIIGIMWGQRNHERREELKGLAAALRGELMAARNICAGRAKSIAGEVEDRLASWPRVRATLYQAYVGRLGFLGADLARQVAAIYGQASDYAAYYSPASGTPDAPKKHALEALARHIDEVLPRLAFIEKTGTVPPAGSVAPMRRMAVETRSMLAAMPAPATPPAHTVPAPGVGQKAPLPPPAHRQTVHYEPPAPNPLWENVTDFLRNCRDSIARSPSPPVSFDPQSAEYTALIEAEMMRYQYEEQEQPEDSFQQKKRG